MQAMRDPLWSDRPMLYGVLSILGAILPWVFFFRFFSTGGGVAEFVPALFANGAAAGFSTDLFISSVAFWIFVFAESRRRGIPRPWLYVAVNLAIGLSCALPLFLAMMGRSTALTERRGSIPLH